MFSLRNIGKSYDGVSVLQDIDLDIEAGEIFGIIGRSGAGKSTLLRLLNQLEKPSTGRVHFAGRALDELDASELRQLRQRIGMVFQHFNLLSSRTVRDNIALPLELAGNTPTQIKKRVDELLDLVGLSAQATRYPSQISGGQKQRVGIARALATEPCVLLCDEATSALDPETTRSILDLLGEINQRLKLSIVLITHQMQVVKSIAHRVAVIDAGRIVERGTSIELFASPQHEITRSLLREVIGQEALSVSNSVRARAEKLLATQPGRFWRLAFVGDQVDQALLAELAEKFSLRSNVLHGYIDEIQGQAFGSLLVVVTKENASAAELDAAAQFVREQNIRLEELAR
ncbi:MAG: ATP-binding cassette domain-containing protein [Pseudomonadota bacterium]